MTGFQEQKLKCFIGELATEDYDLRYDRFTKHSLGECSKYSDKKEIYKDLIDSISKFKPDFEPQAAINKTALKVDSLQEN